MDARSHDLGVGSEIPLKLSYVTSAGDKRIFTGTGIIHSNSYIEASHPLHQIILENVSFPDLPVISNATLAIKPQSEQIYMNCPEINEGVEQIIYIKICINSEETVYTPIDDRFISTDIARTADIPTKTSQLTNDSNFVTSEAIATNYVTTDTNQTIRGKKSFMGDPTSIRYASINSASIMSATIFRVLDSIKIEHNTNYNNVNINSLGKITLADVDGNIDGVLNLPHTGTDSSPETIAVTTDIPTKTSQLTNDSNFVASNSLATVATSGSYNDLTDKPTITNVSGVNDGTNWTSLTIGSDTYGLGGGSGEPVNWSDILNKPTFATVATSGSYNDLSDKPTIPTTTGELTNDSGFITSAALAGYTTEQRVQEMIDASIGTAIGGTY